MAYIIENMEDQLLDAIARPEGWVDRNPRYAEMFENMGRVREGHIEKGTSIKTPDWSLIASMPSTLYDVIRKMSPDGMHLDRKKFYGFLKRNPQYLARDERFGRSPNGTP